jgi:tRNA modification GTPase
MRSLRGDFSERIQALAEAITDLRALVEATLDFPEEDVDFLQPVAAAARLRQLLGNIDAVLEAARQGAILREGLHVVLAGAPNVGKSSLLNRLAGAELAIVTEIPGTTRDAIRESIDVEGVPLHVIDTAGLREASDPLERLGIERTWASIEKADAVVQVVDGAQGVTRADRAISQSLPAGVPRIRVMNKIDLIGAPPRVESTDMESVVWVSAKSGAGIDQLRSELLRLAGWHAEPETVFSARERHLVALRAAREHVQRAAGETGRLELFAEELRLAQQQLGSITGEVAAEDLLGQIFSRFCIGK